MRSGTKLRFLFFLGFILITSGFILPSSAHSASLDCQTQVQQNLQDQKLKLFEEYKRINPHFESWKSGTEAFIRNPNSRSIVYFLHGFMGSPEEMTATHNDLVAKGFAVYGDVIPGFSADADIANEFTRFQWKSRLYKTLDLLTDCYDEVHLVGFSTGALLLHHYMTMRPSDKIRSLTLYSPYYKSSAFYINFMRGLSSYATEAVPVKPVYELTRFPEIRVMVLKPDYYLQSIPLESANEVISLGREMQQRANKGSLNRTPVLLFVSDGDKLIDQSTAIDLVERDFLFVTRQEFKSEKVPHHLMVSEVSPVASKVKEQTLNFISLRTQIY